MVSQLYSLLKLFPFNWVRNYLIGGKVDGRLELRTLNASPGIQWPLAGAQPTEIHEGLVNRKSYASEDIMTRWTVTLPHVLILKNNSPSKAAIYITLPNIDQCFDRYDTVPRQLSLAPLEEFQMNVGFTLYVDHQDGGEVVKSVKPIPKQFLGKILHIDYKNESGNALRTKFRLDNQEDGEQNVYTYPE